MQNPLFYLFNKMWKYSYGNRKSVVLYMTMSVISNLIFALQPLVIGLFLNTIQIQGVSNGNLGYLFSILGLLLIIEFFVWVFHGPSRILEKRNAFYVRKKYKNYLLNGVMALPMEWHSDHHSGDTIDKIEKGTSSLFSFSERTYEIIDTAIALISAFGIILFFDRLAGIVAMGITLFVFFALTFFDRKLVPGYGIVNRAENKISEKIFDILSNITTVIILRVETLVLKSINKSIEAPFKQFDKNNITTEWKWFFSSFCGRIATLAVLGIYIVSNLSTGTILVGTIYILYGYINEVRNTFFRFAYLYNEIVRYRASVGNSEELSKYFHSTDLSGDKRLPKNWSKVKIENLGFSYEAKDNANLHLDNVSFDFSKGERIALIGESGGGKTTFLKIMRDLYQPQKIKLFIDGKLIPAGFSEISDSISLIPQDPELFATTVKDNLTLGVEYSNKRLKEFTDMACFSQVINRLPNKIESSIFEKGVNLSGGEKQRLALARGLLASVDKDIILLDEPTSSVDFQNELNVFKNIFSAFPMQTIIASVHRLHLLSLFNRVYFFEGGKIIASGTFEELKKNSSEFNILWERYIKTRDNEV